jgi:hypothetical protein
LNYPDFPIPIGIMYTDEKTPYEELLKTVNRKSSLDEILAE